jgi:hypothetical protein
MSNPCLASVHCDTCRVVVNPLSRALSGLKKILSQGHTEGFTEISKRIGFCAPASAALVGGAGKVKKSDTFVFFSLSFRYQIFSAY